MTFVAGAVIWSGYLLGWWGWLALTDRVQPGQPESFWWPSIKDLVVPGKVNFAVPPRLLKSTAGSLPGLPPAAQGVDAQGRPLDPGKYSEVTPQPGKYGAA